MLTLTDGATQAIHGLVGENPERGLRIFSQTVDGDQMQLGLSVSDGPEPTDEVIEQSGCHVFVDQNVAPLVDGRTLDAQSREGQRIKFAFVS